jgi:hypothetical protein
LKNVLGYRQQNSDEAVVATLRSPSGNTMQLFQKPMLFTAVAKVRCTKRKTAFGKAVLQYKLLNKRRVNLAIW